MKPRKRYSPPPISICLGRDFFICSGGFFLNPVVLCRFISNDGRECVIQEELRACVAMKLTDRLLSSWLRPADFVDTPGERHRLSSEIARQLKEISFIRNKRLPFLFKTYKKPPQRRAYGKPAKSTR